MRRVRTAVIGTGFMGRVHSEAIRRLGHVDIAAVVAHRAADAKAFGESFGIDRATADYREVLADPAPRRAPPSETMRDHFAKLFAEYAQISRSVARVA